MGVRRKAGAAYGGCGRLPAAAPESYGYSAVRERGEKEGGEGGKSE